MPYKLNQVLEYISYCLHHTNTYFNLKPWCINLSLSKGHSGGRKSKVKQR